MIKIMTNELITVIVPVYKVEAYLGRCIKSIISQSYRNLEVILVDDGSPDACPKMCDDWAKKDERIKVIHKENGGLSDARNIGVDAATGRYLYPSMKENVCFFLKVILEVYPQIYGLYEEYNWKKNAKVLFQQCKKELDLKTKIKYIIFEYNNFLYLYIQKRK